ncbi:MAG: 2-oxoacid:acceptor oxidoreductase family protein [Synergistetes bacterium]|nr:2-oxoacid:acceptor oxidoreductase family protein [Synergistota bacterium]MCX8128225.1 2-oxoacid:acceptor oxidoreductase family protein [Synergistota bacterium]MDW8192672.1 2-oxoacid:acceptor oxidoreductase family protein [Synergistota bacterium]
MNEKIILAGFGGQGILLAGRLLALAAMKEGKYVTWIPSYGPEMRGGTANCAVTISDDLIGSPIISFPNVLFVFNQPSLEKFLPKLLSKGLLIYDNSLVYYDDRRKDIDVIAIPATQLSVELGDQRVANLIMLGAYISKRGFPSEGAFLSALKEVLGDRKASMFEINEKAFRKGLEYGKSA